MPIRKNRIRTNNRSGIQMLAALAPEKGGDPRSGEDRRHLNATSVVANVIYLPDRIWKPPEDQTESRNDDPHPSKDPQPTPEIYKLPHGQLRRPDK